ncbi:MAG: 50S ribosomal protein L18e [Candidatus Methanofastidiosia archaeon]
MKKIRKTNPNLVEIVENLRKRGYENNVALWIALSKKLSKASRKRSEVNLSKIDRFTKEGDTVAVPGKVLGTGNLNHKVTVAAFKFSETAKERIGKEGEAISLEELMKRKPKGSNVKILGG